MQPFQLVRSSVIVITILSTIGCQKSKDNGGNPPDVRAEEEGVNENIKECMRKEFTGTTAQTVSPYDAVVAYRKCGGPDDSKIFSIAAEALFNVKDGSNLTLK